MKLIKALGKWILVCFIAGIAVIALIHIEKMTGIDGKFVYWGVSLLALIFASAWTVLFFVYQIEARKQLGEIKAAFLEMIQPHIASEVVCVPLGTLNSYTGRNGKRLHRFRERKQINRLCFAILAKTELIIVTMNILFVPDAVAFAGKRSDLGEVEIRKGLISKQYIVVMQFPDMQVKMRLPLHARGTDLTDQEFHVRRFLEEIKKD